jgi:hypothetical protein
VSALSPHNGGSRRQVCRGRAACLVGAKRAEALVGRQRDALGSPSGTEAPRVGGPAENGEPRPREVAVTLAPVVVAEPGPAEPELGRSPVRGRVGTSALARPPEHGGRRPACRLPAPPAPASPNHVQAPGSAAAAPTVRLVVEVGGVAAVGHVGATGLRSLGMSGPAHRTGERDQQERRAASYAKTGTASEAIDSISAAARSNSSSESTGVPSNGRSRWMSTHERQPPYSSRTFTVTGRGIR